MSVNKREPLSASSIAHTRHVSVVAKVVNMAMARNSLKKSMSRVVYKGSGAWRYILGVHFIFGVDKRSFVGKERKDHLDSEQPECRI